MTIELLDIVGVAGTSLILFAFACNQLRYWSTETIWYDLTNMVGALVLVVYAYLLGSVPFAILNLVWFAVSARDVISFLIKDK